MVVVDELADWHEKNRQLEILECSECISTRFAGLDQNSIRHEHLKHLASKFKARGTHSYLDVFVPRHDVPPCITEASCVYFQALLSYWVLVKSSHVIGDLLRLFRTLVVWEKLLTTSRR